MTVEAAEKRVQAIRQEGPGSVIGSALSEGFASHGPAPTGAPYSGLTPTGRPSA